MLLSIVKRTLVVRQYPFNRVRALSCAGELKASCKMSSSQQEADAGTADNNASSSLSYSEGAKLPENAPAWAVAASERLQERRENGYVADLDVPPGVKRVLLHSCCAPCSGAMIEEMVEKQDADVTIFFYNPNIHPRAEYELRKRENEEYARRLGVPFVDGDYDPDEWYKRARGMEFSPERGRRCTMCFDMRMDRTALYAHEWGFSHIATTNSTSRWKDEDQVDDSGRRAAAKYDLTYLDDDWKTDVMTARKYEINASEQFYKQEYCGCSFSLRDCLLYTSPSPRD